MFKVIVMLCTFVALIFAEKPEDGIKEGQIYGKVEKGDKGDTFKTFFMQLDFDGGYEDKDHNGLSIVFTNHMGDRRVRVNIVSTKKLAQFRDIEQVFIVSDSDTLTYNVDYYTDVFRKKYLYENIVYWMSFEEFELLTDAEDLYIEALNNRIPIQDKQIEYIATFYMRIKRYAL